MISVNTTLTVPEADTLSDIIRNNIIKHRHKARLDHIAGRISDPELRWHLKHADHIEGLAKKLFPGWSTV